MKPEDVPQTWAAMAGAEVLANLFDRRGIKQALWEIDEETLSEMRETIGRAALAAVLPMAMAEEREACAALCKAKADHYQKQVSGDYDDDPTPSRVEAEAYGSTFTAHELERAIRARGGA